MPEVTGQVRGRDSNVLPISPFTQAFSPSTAFASSAKASLPVRVSALGDQNQAAAWQRK